MSELSLPVFIDFSKAVALESAYDADIDEKFLPRLTDVCEKIVRSVHVSFRFFRDLQGLNTVKGTISFEGQFTCERCGKPFVKEINAAFESTVDGEKAKSLKIDDKLDIIELEPNGQFALLSYLEDCLLLEIPYAPVHDTDDEDCCCGRTEWSYGEISTEKTNPFASLASLKEKLK